MARGRRHWPQSPSRLQRFDRPGVELDNQRRRAGRGLWHPHLAKDAGADITLHKPISADVLLDAVEDYFSLHRSAPGAPTPRLALRNTGHPPRFGTRWT